MNASKPSATPTGLAFLAGIIDRCPETGEPQKLVYASGTEKGHDHLTVITRGKSTAWKHTIITEEMDPANLPQWA